MGMSSQTPRTDALDGCKGGIAFLNQLNELTVRMGMSRVRWDLQHTGGNCWAIGACVTDDGDGVSDQILLTSTGGAFLPDDAKKGPWLVGVQNDGASTRDIDKRPTEWWGMCANHEDGVDGETAITIAVTTLRALRWALNLPDAMSFSQWQATATWKADLIPEVDELRDSFTPGPVSGYLYRRGNWIAWDPKARQWWCYLERGEPRSDDLEQVELELYDWIGPEAYCQ
jgi:hypothetical protein